MLSKACYQVRVAFTLLSARIEVGAGRLDARQSNWSDGFVNNCQSFSLQH